MARAMCRGDSLRDEPSNRSGHPAASALTVRCRRSLGEATGCGVAINGGGSAEAPTLPLNL